MDPYDAALLKRMTRGDKGALQEAHSRYADRVFAYIRGFTGRSDDDEEILQDTFLALWHGAGGIEGRSALLTWLIGVARRKALVQMRRSQRRGQPAALRLEDFSDVPADGPGPEEQALHSAAAEEVARLVGELTPLHREVLILAFVYELSYQEMAHVLDVPLGTLKSRLWAARTGLARAVCESGAAAPSTGAGSGAVGPALRSGVLHGRR
jgi:RNA polymerase sigma-70 factor (ECF subfamily)